MPEWEGAARSLVDARYGVLVGYARLVSGGPNDAEDLVQEALISTFSRRRTFNSIPEAEAYVRRAIVSRFLDAARRSSRAKHGTARESDVAVTGHAEHVGLAMDLSSALTRLTPRERACVMLRHLDGLSVAETAHALRHRRGLRQALRGRRARRTQRRPRHRRGLRRTHCRPLPEGRRPMSRLDEMFSDALQREATTPSGEQLAAVADVTVHRARRHRRVRATVEVLAALVVVGAGFVVGAIVMGGNATPPVSPPAPPAQTPRPARSSRGWQTRACPRRQR